MPEPVQGASTERLADVAAAIAPGVERAVLTDRLSADRAIATALRDWRDLGPAEQRLVASWVLALFRWKGWVELLGLETIEARLIASVLLESDEVPEACRIWARRSRWDPGRLAPLGDAPTWHARVDGLRQLLGEKPPSGDPWRLFPDWLRELLASVKGQSKAFQLDALKALQTPASLWVRAQGEPADKVWKELQALGIRPWIHRQVAGAARLPASVDVARLALCVSGHLEIQELSSQLVGRICDPDPGERWWVVNAGGGGTALHLAALMNGKGVVIAGDTSERKLKDLARRARRSPFRNLSTRLWDGKHLVGKSGSFQGILVEPPSTGIGGWRRHPDDRWRLDSRSLAEFPARQLAMIALAVPGLRKGGTLVYSVPTITPEETSKVVAACLDRHPGLKLDPFPNPLDQSLTDGTLTVWPNQADVEARFVARFVMT
ncbi:MAG: RsmB/NOP family class I SAM-dependent RNA methyltransferase [Isosphaeraceae bacterium]